MNKYESRYAVGDRVGVPDPQKINPFGSPPAPHGPGTIAEVIPPKYQNGNPLYAVDLDSGEQIKIGELFLQRLDRLTLEGDADLAEDEDDQDRHGTVESTEQNGLILRRARKQYACAGSGAMQPTHSEDCPRTINAGDQYVECQWEAHAYQAGSRHCLVCAVETLGWKL